MVANTHLIVVSSCLEFKAPVYASSCCVLYVWFEGGVPLSYLYLVMVEGLIETTNMANLCAHSEHKNKIKVDVHSPQHVRYLPCIQLMSAMIHFHARFKFFIFPSHRFHSNTILQEP